MYSKNTDINDIYYLCEVDNLIKIEQWKMVENYPKYHVSDLGRIKSFKLKSPNILNPCVSRDGYYYLTLSGNIKKKLKIHRLVAIAFIPNPENKPQVNHKKGIKIDNRAISLEWNTSFENIQHAYDNGLINIQKGEQRKNSKLTETDVLYIRKSNLTCQKLADKYSVAIGLIHGIRTFKRWKHVKT